MYSIHLDAGDTLLKRLIIGKMWIVRLGTETFNHITSFGHIKVTIFISTVQKKSVMISSTRLSNSLFCFCLSQLRPCLSPLCSGRLPKVSTACVQKNHGWQSSAQLVWSTCTLVVSCWSTWRSWRTMTGSWRCSMTRWGKKDDGFIAGSGSPLIVFYSQHKHFIGSRYFPLHHSCHSVWHLHLNIEFPQGPAVSSNIYWASACGLLTSHYPTQLL